MLYRTIVPVVKGWPQIAVLLVPRTTFVNQTSVKGYSKKTNSCTIRENFFDPVTAMESGSLTGRCPHEIKVVVDHWRIHFLHGSDVDCQTDRALFQEGRMSSLHKDHTNCWIFKSVAILPAVSRQIHSNSLDRPVNRLRIDRAWSVQIDDNDLSLNFPPAEFEPDVLSGATVWPRRGWTQLEPSPENPGRFIRIDL